MALCRVFVRLACNGTRVIFRDAWRSHHGIGGITQRAARWCGISGAGTGDYNHHKGPRGAFGTSPCVHAFYLGTLPAPEI